MHHVQIGSLRDNGALAMTQHEFLNFTVALRDHIEEKVGKRSGQPAAAVWPTREALVENLGLNLDHFGAGVTQSGIRAAIATASKRHWIVVAGCMKDCHAKHVIVTELGLEALRLMDEQGCERHGQWKKKRPECRVDGRFRFAA